MQQICLEYYEKGFTLSNYCGKHIDSDVLSSVIRMMKNTQEFRSYTYNNEIIQGWTHWLYTSISSLDLNFDLLLRVLGHAETTIDEEKPLNVISQKLASHIGANFKPDLLLKHKATPKQRSSDPLPDLNRRINIKGSFKVSSSYKLLSHKNILIIDDVLTTGATLREVGMTLHEANSSNNLYFFTLAYANRCTNPNTKEVFQKYFKDIPIEQF